MAADPRQSERLVEQWDLIAQGRFVPDVAGDETGRVETIRWFQAQGSVPVPAEVRRHARERMQAEIAGVAARQQLGSIAPAAARTVTARARQAGRATRPTAMHPTRRVTGLVSAALLVAVMVALIVVAFRPGGRQHAVVPGGGSPIPAAATPALVPPSKSGCSAITAAW
jgi:hypothetical protein